MINQLLAFITSQAAQGKTKTVTDAYGDPLEYVPFDVIRIVFGQGIGEVIAVNLGVIANERQTKIVDNPPGGSLLVWEDEEGSWLTDEEGIPPRRMKILGVALAPPSTEDAIES